MLCDEIRNRNTRDEPGPLHTTLNTFADEIARARRYCLDDSVTQTACLVCTERPSSILKIVELARPPTRSTWIEWVDSAKDKTLLALGLQPDQRGLDKPSRVGALLTSTNDDGTEYLAEFSWNFPNGDIEFSSAAIQFDLNSEDPAAVGEIDRIRREIEEQSTSPSSFVSLHANRKKELDAYVRLGLKGSIIPGRVGHILSAMAHDKGDQLKQFVRANYISHSRDVEVEGLFLISVLLLLNSPNGVTYRSEDRVKLNKARVKSKKRPLLDIDTVIMRLSKPEQQASRGMGGGGGGTKSLHICRGHFKKRVGKDGITRPIWWREHRRGNMTLGVAPNPTRIVKV